MKTHSLFITHHSSLITRSGFTLLEVCIAMTIAMLILGVAVMGITGVADEQRLRETAATIEGHARNALLDAIAKHQPVQLALDGSLSGGSTVEVKRYGEKNFRTAESGEFWEFSPTGVCEPIELRLISTDGVIELGFDPLTGCARHKSIIVNG